VATPVSRNSARKRNRELEVYPSWWPWRPWRAATATVWCVCLRYAELFLDTGPFFCCHENALRDQGHFRGTALACAFGLLFALARVTSAATVDVEISGVINFHSANTPTGYWDGTVTNGTPYTFSLQFDSLTPDTNPDPTSGVYNSSGAPFQLSISFGDYVFTTTGNTVTVWNDFFNGTTTQDGIFFSNLNAFTQNGLSLSQNGIQTNFFFSNTSFLSSDSLSEVKTYPLTDFSQTYMLVSGSFNNGNGIQTATLQGTIDSFVVVPEPATWILMGIGAVMLFGAQQFRRKRKTLRA
jgi:hypothetical protein